MDPFDWIYELELKSKLSSKQKIKWAKKIVLHAKNSIFFLPTLRLMRFNHSSSHSDWTARTMHFIAPHFVTRHNSQHARAIMQIVNCQSSKCCFDNIYKLKCSFKGFQLRPVDLCISSDVYIADDDLNTIVYLLWSKLHGSFQKLCAPTWIRT